jgi:hypothetical protein
LDKKGGNLSHSQLIEFLDNPNSDDFKHIVLFYEEPEYARLIQIRFLNNGLGRGEMCVYSASDDEDLRLTHIAMQEQGIDVAKYSERGILQFHIRSPKIIDPESYKAARLEFQQLIENTFMAAPNHDNSMPDRLRGVGSIDAFAFVNKITVFSHQSAASRQLMVEHYFQSESGKSYPGMWMCKYQMDDIIESMSEDFMKQLLDTHDAVLYLRQFQNGTAMDIRK